ncbi:MAG TPA: enoyl-CoA hydratase/isomerase family protein [Methylomirabilota bacterium]|jgi:enoyl-CoA hydratase/carnithine racemase|nr:enoyl-CoA hydratase/isomerase family protein [Methylomirabilota bacterium]
MERIGEHVRYETAGGVGRITLARPRVLNALDGRLVAELADAVVLAARDPEAWVVVVTGEGRAFSSGMDRTALSGGAIGEPFFRDWIRALNGLEDMGKLVVAAIRGYCLGGGLQLALACDFRLCAADAVLALGATRHGLIPDGAVLRLARIVGLGRAKELALLNDPVTPAQALAMGLVTWVVPPEALEAELERVVGRCLEAAPTAARHTKRLLLASFHADPRGLIEDVVGAQRECLTSWEMREANRAWDERREARFVPPPA